MGKRRRQSATKVQLSEAQKLGESLARSPYRMFAPDDLASKTLTVSDVAAALAPLAKDVAGTIQRIDTGPAKGSSNRSLSNTAVLGNIAAITRPPSTVPRSCM